LKYPYFAIKHQFFITYIEWATQRHAASFGTTPFNLMGFQLGRPNRPEQSSYRRNPPILLALAIIRVKDRRYFEEITKSDETRPKVERF
jgi:hypothetical protein